MRKRHRKKIMKRCAEAIRKEGVNPIWCQFCVVYHKCVGKSRDGIRKEQRYDFKV